MHPRCLLQQAVPQELSETPPSSLLRVPAGEGTVVPVTAFELGNSSFTLAFGRRFCACILLLQKNVEPNR